MLVRLFPAAQQDPRKEGGSYPPISRQLARASSTRSCAIIAERGARPTQVIQLAGECLLPRDPRQSKRQRESQGTAPKTLPTERTALSLWSAEARATTAAAESGLTSPKAPANACSIETKAWVE
jgi:hypothetical protein